MSTKRPLTNNQATAVMHAWQAFRAQAAYTPETIYAFCCGVAAIRKRKPRECGNCYRQITARQRYRPCPHCGFKGNWKLATREKEGETENGMDCTPA